MTEPRKPDRDIKSESKTVLCAIKYLKHVA